MNIVNSNLYINGTDEPFTKIEVFEGDYANKIYDCGYFEDCDNPLVLTDLPVGLYTIKVQSYYANASGRWIEVCFFVERVEITDGGNSCTDKDNDSVCEVDDCDDNVGVVIEEELASGRCQVLHT